MAKKTKKAEKPQREFTRRQLSHWKQQRRRQRIILNGGIFIIAAVILIVLVGWYLGEYRPLHQTVIRVNDTEFDMAYYLDALIFAGGEEPTLENLQGIAGGMIMEIENDELIRQGALALGISVSDDEAREKLNSLGVIINDASLDMARSAILQDKLRNEYFQSQVPTSTEQVHIMAMLLESESQAREIRDRLQNSENFTALAEEFSLDYYTKNNKGDLGWHPEDILAELLGSSLPGEYAFGSEAGVLSQPRYDEEITKEVGYWLVRVTDREYEDEAQVQAILLGSEEEAQDVRARLEAGEDLATLAEELSQFEESRKQGGELGLVDKGEMSPAVDEFIFSADTELGTWSEPIRDETLTTKGGYWLIEVLDRDNNRPLEKDDRDNLLDKEFNDWFSLLWVNSADGIDDSYLDYEKQIWAIERVTKG